MLNWCNHIWIRLVQTHLPAQPFYQQPPPRRTTLMYNAGDAYCQFGRQVILLFDSLSFLNMYWIVTVVHVYSFINVRDNSISGFRWIALSRNFFINLLSINHAMLFMHSIYLIASMPWACYSHQYFMCSFVTFYWMKVVNHKNYRTKRFYMKSNFIITSSILRSFFAVVEKSR